MLMYLSSDKLGNRTEILKQWIREHNHKIALIPNAKDSYATAEIREEKICGNAEYLKAVGFIVSVVDLREYFGKEKKLRKALEEFRAVYVSGGNMFVLRQAMQLSGFDQFIISLKNKEEYLYVGTSAGICVLAENFRGAELADDPDANPYQIFPHNPIWEGVGLLQYLPVPHFRSGHRESEGAEKTVAELKKNKLPHKVLRDGEVIVMNTVSNTEKIYRL